MTSHIPQIEVLSGPERRRRWSTAEKLAIAQETYGPDVTVRARPLNAESGWGFPWLPNSDSIAPTVDLVGGNMTRAFSDDLRSRVLAASRDGMSARSAAARFGIGISTAIAWIASARAGQLTPAKQGRRGGSRLDAHENFIIGMIEEEKDITLNEMVLRLRKERAVSIGRSALDVGLTGSVPRGNQQHQAQGRPQRAALYPREASAAGAPQT